MSLNFESQYPPGSLVRIWARQYENGDTLGLDGSEVFEVLEWGQDFVRVGIMYEQNEQWHMLRDLVIRILDIVAMKGIIFGTIVTITLDIGTNEFGSTEDWEASLYEGAVPQEETDGRFTDWVQAVNNRVTFRLPQDVREGFEIPWNEPDNTYVRLRTTEGYPTFDIVTEPFTLQQNRIYKVPVQVTSTPIVLPNVDSEEQQE
ncbi:hypothetical protein PRVXT_002158 [Proteinivorax tanatarense]|uniref:Uncharacterized protein n=1 Tax=Proteinivorax tanatarense TaxID=1260629 RepID=A0AAU7VJC6_9FIRM